jgi:L-ribulokinase
MFAAVVAGIYNKIEDAQQAMGQGFTSEYHPDQANHALYMKLYEKYREIGLFTENL